MKQLALFAFLLLFGGALQAQHMDCRDRLIDAGQEQTLIVECEDDSGARHATATQIPILEITSNLPEGVYRVLLFLNGILVSEEIHIQD